MKVKMVFFTLSIFLFSGFNANAYDPPLSQEQIKKLPHISAVKAYSLFKQNKIFLLDVHDISGKKDSKIIGAYYFPSKRIKKSKINLPKKVIIGVF